MFEEISFCIFFIASFTTGLGFSIIWVYTGQTIQNLQDFFHNNNNNNNNKQKNNKEIILLVLGSLSAVVLLGLIGFYTKKHVLELTENSPCNVSAIHTSIESPSNKSRRSNQEEQKETEEGEEDHQQKLQQQQLIEEAH
jgi:undecaprenyl pyrophosphate phosphatase UppP